MDRDLDYLKCLVIGSDFQTENISGCRLDFLQFFRFDGGSYYFVSPEENYIYSEKIIINSEEITINTELILNILELFRINKLILAIPSEISGINRN